MAATVTIPETTSFGRGARSATVGGTYTQNVTVAHNEVYNLPYSGINSGYGWGAFVGGELAAGPHRQAAVVRQHLPARGAGSRL